MKRYKVYILAFSLLLLLGSSCFDGVHANDAEVEALREEIATLENKRNQLALSKAKTEKERDDARKQLESLAESIDNVDAYIKSARAALAAADNDAERQDWLAVIADLAKYRQKLLYQYNSAAYTIQLLDTNINTLVDSPS